MFNSDLDIYIQIAQMVENDILTGLLREEEQAPSTNEFAKSYGINPATARKGLNILVDEGILYKKRGLGMFVSQGARTIVVKKRKKEFIDRELPRLVAEAKRLDLNLEELNRELSEVWNDSI